MEKIYSRERIRIKKSNLILLFILFGIFIMYLFLRFVVYPVYDAACENKAKEIASKISTEVTRDIMKEYEYEDIVSIVKDEDDDIKFVDIKTDVLNNIMTDITENIQKQIDDEKDTQISIKIGNFLGNKILAGYGPEIYFRIESLSNFTTNLYTEFYSVGINQSLHRIYLNISCNVNITTPLNKICQISENKVLLVESIILGNVPDTFYDAGSMENTIMITE